MLVMKHIVVTSTSVRLCGSCATTAVPQDRFQGLRNTSRSLIIEMLSGRGGEDVVWCPLD